MSRINIFLLSGLVLASCSSDKQPKEVEINDSTTPLHLLQPDYTTPYKVLSVDSVKADIDRVFSYIDSVTPARVVNEDGEVIDNLTNLPDDAKLNQGTYRLTSYEWGVMYMALLDAYNTLGDAKYKDYVSDRIGFLAKAAPAFAELASRTGRLHIENRRHNRALLRHCGEPHLPSCRRNDSAQPSSPQFGVARRHVHGSPVDGRTLGLHQRPEAA